LKALGLLQAFKESADWALPSSLSDDLNLHISVFEQLISTYATVFSAIVLALQHFVHEHGLRISRLKIRSVAWNWFLILQTFADWFNSVAFVEISNFYTVPEVARGL